MRCKPFRAHKLSATKEGGGEDYYSLVSVRVMVWFTVLVNSEAVAEVTVAVLRQQRSSLSGYPLHRTAYRY